MPAPRIIAVEPDACATISRGERGPTKIQGLARRASCPRTTTPSVVDEVRTVSDDDAWRTKVELAQREGLLVGISAGAAVRVALDVARELGAGQERRHRPARHGRALLQPRGVLPTRAA